VKNAVSISARPASVEDRAVPGHWQGDLLAGSPNSDSATRVERQSRYVILVKVANKDTSSVVSALIKQAHKLPRALSVADLGPGQGARRSSAGHPGHRCRRLFLRPEKPMAAGHQ
jgi:IS30 family transposase